MTTQKHDVQSPYRHMKALLLAGALTIVAASVAHATEGPGGPGDDNGRSGVRTADDTGPGSRRQ